MLRNRLIDKLIAAVFLLTASEGFAQDTTKTVNKFSLAQSFDYAKQHSTQVKNALLDIKIQRQTNRDITSIALPQISGSGSVTHNFDIPVQTIPNFIGPATYQVLVDEGVTNGSGTPVALPSSGDFGNLLFPFGSPWNANGGLTLSQVIFDGQVFIALKAKNRTIHLQEKVADLTEERIRENIYKVYFQLVAGKIQTQLLDANISRLEKLKHDITIMYDNGFAEKLDINKITVQIANLQTEMLKADNSILNGYAGLKILMGMPIKDSLVLTDSLSDNKIRDGVLEASQFKYADRNDFQVSEITNQLNTLNVKRYQLSQLPSLALVGSYSKQAQRNKFDLFEKQPWFTSSYAGIQLKVPIFNGFSLAAKTQQAKLELQKSRNETEALKISIDADIETSRNNFIIAIANMDNQKENMALAEEVYNQTKKKFEIGTGSTTEINTAEVDLKTAQTNFTTALYDAIIAKGDFLKATGKF